MRGVNPPKANKTLSKFVLQSFDGRPYFSYLPRKLTRNSFTSFESERAQFFELDRQFGKRASALAGTSLELEQRGDYWAKSEKPELLAAECLICSRRIDGRALIEANARAMSTARSALRRGASWIGASHPAEAWYIGPPASMISSLVDNLCDLVSESELPVSLRACVSLLQFLQVHPFDDGNGRTSRALFTALLVRQFGRKLQIMKALGHLWEFQGMRLHQASLSLRDTDSWSAFLTLSLDAFALNMAGQAT